MRLSILITLIGFILLPMALYLYLPWLEHEKALALLIMSIAYLVLPGAIALLMFSAKNWLKMFEAGSLLTADKRN